MAFEDKLLKISRKYTDNELVNLARNRNTELNIEIGKLKSYIVELEDKIKNNKKRKLSPQVLQELRTKDWVKEIFINDEIIKLKKEVSHLNKVVKTDSRYKEVKQLLNKERKSKRDWRTKYLSLLTKYNKII